MRALSHSITPSLLFSLNTICFISCSDVSFRGGSEDESESEEEESEGEDEEEEAADERARGKKRVCMSFHAGPELFF